MTDPQPPSPASPDFVNRVYGALIGGAIGDALGAPTECMWYSDIRATYGRVEEFLPGTAYALPHTRAAGTVTDDTRLRHLLCATILRHRRRVGPDDFAALWLERLDPDEYWFNERIVVQKLRLGMDPWTTGRGTPPTGCASMCMAPIGIVNAGDPRQAYLDELHIAAINQDGVDRSGAAVLAAAVAEAFRPGASVASILQVMQSSGDFVIQRAVALALDLAGGAGNAASFTELFYEKMLDRRWPAPDGPHPGEWSLHRPWSGSSIEIVPAVAGLIATSGDDINECLIEAASFGRDCDTIASIAGNILGALYGATALRPRWITECEEANSDLLAKLEPDLEPSFRAMAIALSEVVAAIADQQQQRADQLRQIVI